MLWADGCHTSQGFRKHSRFFQISLLKTFPLPFFSLMEISKGQSGMVVERWPGKGRSDWLEPLRPRMGSTEAGVTSAPWGSAMDNPLLWAGDLLLEPLLLCSYCFPHPENALFVGMTSQSFMKGTVWPQQIIEMPDLQKLLKHFVHSSNGV